MIDAAVRRAVADAAVIAWDFDGSLADTEPLHEASFRRQLAELGAPAEDDFFPHLVGRAEIENWEWLRERYGLAPTVPELVARRSELYADLARGLRPNAFVREVMEAAPHARHVVTSAAHWENLGHLLAGLDVANRFAAVWCEGAPDDASPDKRGRLERVVEVYGRPAVLVEDADRWLSVGRELGMRCLRVRHRYNGGAELPALTVAD